MRYSHILLYRLAVILYLTTCIGVATAKASDAEATDDRITWNLFIASEAGRKSSNKIAIAACTNILHLGAPPLACDSIEKSFDDTKGKTITVPILGLPSEEASGFVEFHPGEHMDSQEVFFSDGIPVAAERHKVLITKASHHIYNIVFTP